VLLTFGSFNYLSVGNLSTHIVLLQTVMSDLISNFGVGFELEPLNFLYESPGWPVEEPVLIFTLALLAFLVGPLVIERLGQPGIVGIVLLGAALGPGGLNLLEESETIVLLGNVGLVYLLFTVGLEMDLRGFKQDPDSAAIFGLTSFFVPFTLGTGAGVVLLDLDIWAALLLAAVFASHTLLAYPIANKYGVTKNRAVTAVFGGILFTDTLALIILALVVGGHDGGLTPILLLDIALSLVILFGATWFVVGRTARWFFQNFSEESYFEFLFVAVVFFAAASLAELLDIAAILGAFVAGIALNRLIPPGGTLMTRIEFVGNALFIPFFLLWVGILVDPAVILDGPRTLQVAGVIIVVMFIGKWLAAQAVGTVKGYDGNERSVIFGLSTGQAAAALAVTIIGVEEGLFSEAVLNAVVLLLLVTAIISPWLTRRASNKLALAREATEDDGEVTDPRILLPLSHHAEQQRRLLEFSFVLKSETKEQPVNVLTVISPSGGEEETEQRVAETRESMGDLVEIGNEADVELETETRVNHNPASGIVRGSVEVQADMILMGWDAKQSLTHRMFGSVIDRVLERTRVPVLIARLGHPINTTERMFVVVPHGVDTQEGFFEGVHFVKKIADRVNAELEVLLIGSSEDQYNRLFELVEPELEATFTELESWNKLLPYLEDTSNENDLVTVLSPRQGRVGWHERLRTLPVDLEGLPPASFVVVTLREDDPEYDRKFLQYG